MTMQDYGDEEKQMDDAVDAAGGAQEEPTEEDRIINELVGRGDGSKYEDPAFPASASGIACVLGPAKDPSEGGASTRRDGDLVGGEAGVSVHMI